MPNTAQADLPGGTALEGVANTAPQVPIIFRNFEEASGWLNLLQKCIVDAMRTTLKRRDELRAVDQIACEVSRDPVWLEIRDKLMVSLDHWTLAFQPLRIQAEGKQQDDPQTFSRSIVMVLQAMMLRMGLYTSHLRDYNAMIESTPVFREVVRVVSMLPKSLVQEIPGGCFTMAGPVFMLFLCATKCRDAGIRADAERLLRESPRLDGLWDSHAALAICEWTKALEAEYEAFMSGPEEVWNKIRDRQVRFDDKENVAWARAERLDPETGEWYEREDKIVW
jgi:hypothetical protein